MANLTENNTENKFLNNNGTYNSREWNNGTNQDIKRDFVHREVYVCVSQMIEELIKAYYIDSSIGFDLYEYQQFYFTASDGNEYTQDDAEEKSDKIENIIFCYNELTEADGVSSETIDHLNTKISKLEELKEEFDNADFDEVNEIYEWWSVSSYLADKLEEKGETIIREYGLCIWGRCTTGQAILLDSVISRVCEDLEILQGQKSDWSKQ